MVSTTERNETAQATTPSGWTGWIVFAGLMMVIAGTMNAIYGFIALIEDEWVVWGNEAVMVVDVTQWGWIHLILGVVVILAGLGALSGNTAARIVAVIVAGISLLVNFVALPIYPIWSLLVITVDVLVIWALIVHGRELKNAP